MHRNLVVAFLPSTLNEENVGWRIGLLTVLANNVTKSSSGQFGQLGPSKTSGQVVGEEISVSVLRSCELSALYN